MYGAATKKGSGAVGGATETRNFTNCSATGKNGPTQSIVIQHMPLMILTVR